MSIPIPASASADVQAAFRAVEAFRAKWDGSQNIDLHGRRIINAGLGVDAFDYVTRLDLDTAAMGTGEPDTLSAPQGTPPTVLYGLHAERLALSVGTLTEGTLFYETDRAALYQLQDDGAGALDWYLAMCRPLRTSEAKPSDLGNNDAGFTWFDQVEGIYWRWSGGVWNYYIGSYRAAFASMPSAAEADRGFLFIASDRGDHVWRKGASAFQLLEGVGGPTRGTLANITTGLTANDAGYLYYATDYDRTYRWTGTAWEDAPGQPPREMVVYRNSASAPTGWALCDGAAANISTSTGGTAAYTTPNLTGANKFIRSATGAGGVGGADTHDHTYSTVIAHTHPVLKRTSAGGSTTAFSEAAIVTDAATTDPVSGAVSITGSATGTTDAGSSLPSYHQLVPFIRL